MLAPRSSRLLAAFCYQIYRRTGTRVDQALYPIAVANARPLARTHLPVQQSDRHRWNEGMKRDSPVRRQRPRSRLSLLSPRPESRSAKYRRDAKEHVSPTSEICVDQNRGGGNRREKESGYLACEMRAMREDGGTTPSR